MLALVIAVVPPARANGQTSHQGITVDAIGRVADEGLAELLARDDVRDALLNGTMFPDGGYAVDDGYGELAHWEPTQDAYLDWIVANHPPPFDDEGAQHVAFLLGLRSHGMADQFYDATYMERSRAYDPAESWACCSMDEATDVAFAVRRGAGTVPAPWWPDSLIESFAAQGHTVAGGTIDDGMALLGVAIWGVGRLAENPDAVAEYEALFPWACAHQFDPRAVGRPEHEAEVVAAYWKVTWDRLNGATGWESPVIHTFPPAGGTVAARGADDLDARLEVVFAKGLDPDSVTAQTVTVTDASGAAHPVAPHVFYGWNSHVVNIAPEADWAADTDYVLTLHPGIRTFDGYTLDAAIEVAFTTRAPVDDDTSDPVDDAPAGCGCGSGTPVGLVTVALGALALRRRAR